MQKPNSATGRACLSSTVLTAHNILLPAGVTSRIALQSLCLWYSDRNVSLPALKSPSFRAFILLSVLLLPGRELWLGFDPSTRRPRRDERKYDEIVSSLGNRTLRIHPYYFSYVYQYSSTAVGKHEMMAILGQEEIRCCPNTIGTMTAVQFDWLHPQEVICYAR